MSQQIVQVNVKALDLDAVKQVISMQGWADSLMAGADYVDPDPDYLSRSLMIQTLTATSVTQILSESSVRKLQESVPDVPDGSTGPIEVDDLYVTGSDFGEGAKTYIIFGGTKMETGERFKYSTGATQVQGQFLAMLNVGAWPIKCQVKRTSRKDRGGHYLFRITTPD